MSMVLIITLIIVGMLLIIAEILLIPGIFITGALGLGALAYSSYLGFTLYGNTMGTIIVFANIILVLICIFFALRAKTWRRLSLDDKIESHIDDKPQEKGLVIGTDGITITRLNPVGKAKFNNNLVEVSTISGFIDQNTNIIISDIIDNKIFVKIK